MIFGLDFNFQKRPSNCTIHQNVMYALNSKLNKYIIKCSYVCMISTQARSPRGGQGGGNCSGPQATRGLQVKK